MAGGGNFLGERGRSERRPRFARELDGEREGRERKLTTALNRSETGSGWKLHAAGEEFRRRFSARSRLGAEPRGERGKWGEVRRLAREAGGVLQATEARRKEGIVGAEASAWEVSNRERLGGGAVGGRGWS